MDNGMLKEEIPYQALEIEHLPLNMVLFGKNTAAILLQECVSRKVIAAQGVVRLCGR